ncbi:lytic transglycosylase [Roseovarius sp. SCSIO 43702]|uniref:transglycosylase SLT domain-containing protein n=1 Tax=Roseovarius sp. SCSIO 43702 TaxID=2823043 RepID=UPI001C735C9A|nr:lytic transglycosylase [Roseovarius sp. SCSIO 43702]QYX56480.1 lytic transglycosylase [Roseovarius sp. SCSIO 43702]
MSRSLRAMVLLAFVAACGRGGGVGESPDGLNDACSILSQRPGYLRAFRATERKWGVPVHVQMATIYQESKFDSDARTPFRYTLGVIPTGRQSSAFGYSQALDGTWEEYLADAGSRRARRDNIRDATDFMGWYMNGSRERLGIPLHDTRNQYLAYHEGRTGFSRGSYNAKPWLVRVAGELEARANMYERQLRRCG